MNSTPHSFHGHTHGPPPDGSNMYNNWANGTAQSTPRKRLKVSQACDQCRARKRRCDTIKPCTQCIEDHVFCAYTLPPVVNRRDQHVAEVPKLLKPLTKVLDAQTRRIKDMALRLERLENTKWFSEPDHTLSTSPTIPGNIEYHVGAHDHFRTWPTIAHLLAWAGVRLVEDHVQGLELPEGSNVSSPVQAHPDSPVEWNRHYANNVKSTASRNSPTASKSSKDFQDTLFKSYVKNLHVLHPIVDLKYLETILGRYADRTWESHSASCNQIKFEPQSHASSRLWDKHPHDFRFDQASNIAPGNQARDTLDHALTCIILALGAVCLEKEMEPAPKELDTAHGSPGHFGRDTQRTTLVHPSAGIDASGHRKPDVETILFLEQDRSFISHRRSDSDKNDAQRDVLRSVAASYYAEAEQVLNHHKEGMSLIHAQLFVLASLYQGQQGRSRRSMEWIRNAGHVAQLLLTKHELLHTFDPRDNWEDFGQNYREMQRLVKVPEHDYIVLVAWTCIQLEGELVTGLPFRPSGIQGYESRIPWPYRIPNADAYERLLPRGHVGSRKVSGHSVLVFYTSQIWMRKWLNGIQAQCGRQEHTSDTNKQLRNDLKDQQAALDCWRACLPEEVQWKDSDNPSHDILAARLRATYWAAQSSICRVYVDYLLHITPGMGYPMHIPNLDPIIDIIQRPDAELQFLEAIGTMSKVEIMDGAHCCIKAAVESIIAFDGIKHKLTIPNIHGIAHEQFGNVLILAAASIKRKSLVGHLDLPSLVKRTVAFLNQYASESRNCKIDSAILQRLLQVL